VLYLNPKLFNADQKALVFIQSIRGAYDLGPISLCRPLSAIIHQIPSEQNNTQAHQEAIERGAAGVRHEDFITFDTELQMLQKEVRFKNYLAHDVRIQKGR
jgi:hypothetical protein